MGDSNVNKNTIDTSFLYRENTIREGFRIPKKRKVENEHPTDAQDSAASQHSTPAKSTQPSRSDSRGRFSPGASPTADYHTYRGTTKNSQGGYDNEKTERNEFHSRYQNSSILSSRRRFEGQWRETVESRAERHDDTKRFRDSENSVDKGAYVKQLDEQISYGDRHQGRHTERPEHAERQTAREFHQSRSYSPANTHGYKDKYSDQQKRHRYCRPNSERARYNKTNDRSNFRKNNIENTPNDILRSNSTSPSPTHLPIPMGMRTNTVTHKSVTVAVVQTLIKRSPITTVDKKNVERYSNKRSHQPPFTSIPFEHRTSSSKGQHSSIPANAEEHKIAHKTQVYGSGCPNSTQQRNIHARPAKKGPYDSTICADDDSIQKTPTFIATAIPGVVRFSTNRTDDTDLVHVNQQARRVTEDRADDDNQKMPSMAAADVSIEQKSNSPVSPSQEHEETMDICDMLRDVLGIDKDGNKIKDVAEKQQEFDPYADPLVIASESTWNEWNKHPSIEEFVRFKENPDTETMFKDHPLFAQPTPMEFIREKVLWVIEEYKKRGELRPSDDINRIYMRQSEIAAYWQNYLYQKYNAMASNGNGAPTIQQVTNVADPELSMQVCTQAESTERDLPEVARDQVNPVNDRVQSPQLSPQAASTERSFSTYDSLLTSASTHLTAQADMQLISHESQHESGSSCEVPLGDNPATFANDPTGPLDALQSPIQTELGEHRYSSCSNASTIPYFDPESAPINDRELNSFLAQYVDWYGLEGVDEDRLQREGIAPLEDQSRQVPEEISTIPTIEENMHQELLEQRHTACSNSSDLAFATSEESSTQSTMNVQEKRFVLVSKPSPVHSEQETELDQAAELNENNFEDSEEGITFPIYARYGIDDHAHWREVAQFLVHIYREQLAKASWSSVDLFHLNSVRLANEQIDVGFKDTKLCNTELHQSLLCEEPIPPDALNELDAVCEALLDMIDWSHIENSTVIKQYVRDALKCCQLDNFDQRLVFECGQKILEWILPEVFNWAYTPEEYNITTEAAIFYATELRNEEAKERAELLKSSKIANRKLAEKEHYARLEESYFKIPKGPLPQTFLKPLFKKSQSSMRSSDSARTTAPNLTNASSIAVMTALHDYAQHMERISREGAGAPTGQILSNNPIQNIDRNQPGVSGFTAIPPQYDRPSTSAASRRAAESNRLRNICLSARNILRPPEKN
ncbi:hypothetical protein QR680_003274 [Steinernema hermaphroditum]|uniref:Uncharacterized protein n=1 Tax=Steinernema hermaphroditum TaxID=289476 RepID=A0AA39LJW4_9BILA|nr:hypothetical protein QR680_003274 [Steinernema hermaphroditum]